MSSLPLKTRRLRAAAAFFALSLVACSKVKYPHCKADTDCTGHHEVCVAGQCQECRADDDCAAKYAGEGRTCQAGRCEPPAGCQSDDDCRAKGAGLICREGACAPGCRRGRDCGPNQACLGGVCRPAQCRGDQDCGQGQVCNEGACEAHPDAAAAGQAAMPAECQPDGSVPGQVLRLDAVRFAFNKFDLSDDVMAQLQQVATCLRLAPADLHVVVEGHCDDRGTQEYNLALGQRRAQSVLDYLVRLGADAHALAARSKGENEPTCTTPDEACFAQNRRVEFIQSRGGAP